MIKVNLLPVKKKRKKAKPVPTFIFAAIGMTLIVGAVLAYLVYFFTDRMAARKVTIAANEKAIADLEEKIKAVQDFEAKNADFKKKNEILEQLGKERVKPAKIVDEISALLPPGVWLNTLNISDKEIKMSCTAFTNDDVVAYVGKLKASAFFADVLLAESVMVKEQNYSTYKFSLTLKVKV